VSELERLHGTLNRFDPHSELSLVTRNAVTHPAGMSDELWEILTDCRKYHELTSGLFDVTLSDFNTIEFNPSERTVFFRDKSIIIDLGGYAKGYAMKKIRNLLVSASVSQAFFNFGNSSVMTLGTHPSGKPWLVGIDDPFHPGQQLGTVQLCNQSLSTSGNLPDHSRHIVHPRTGEYFTGKKVISVVAGNDMDAEILSTALLLADDTNMEGIKGNFNNITVHIYNLA
jgi:FAD:protein FMN transferase